MSLFDQLGSQTPSNPMQMLQQLKSDPVGVLKKAGYNIPSGISGPQQMIQYLMNSGQLPMSRFNQAQQMASRFWRR